MTDADLVRAVLDIAGVSYRDRGFCAQGPDYSNAWCVSFAPDGEVVSYHTRATWWRNEEWWERRERRLEAPADAEVAPRGMA